MEQEDREVTASLPSRGLLLGTSLGMGRAAWAAPERPPRLQQLSGETSTVLQEACRMGALQGWVGVHGAQGKGWLTLDMSCPLPIWGHWGLTPWLSACRA